MENKLKLLSPTERIDIRSDPWGDGHFGAPRGDHTHKGIDLRVYHREALVAPLICRVKRIAWPYRYQGKYMGIVLRSANEARNAEIKIFYMVPDETKLWTKSHQVLLQGELIGMAQNISEKYDYRMLSHIHLELRIDGKLVDPEPYLIDRG